MQRPSGPSGQEAQLDSAERLDWPLRGFEVADRVVSKRKDMKPAHERDAALDLLRDLEAETASFLGTAGTFSKQWHGRQLLDPYCMQRCEPSPLVL